MFKLSPLKSVFKASTKIVQKQKFFARALLPLLLLSGCEEKAEKKVAIIQSIDHPALTNSRLGVMDAIVDGGFIPGENVKIQWESAQGNPSLATQIAQKYVGTHVDVLVTVGTMPSQAGLQVAQGTKTALVYVTVTDPAASKLTEGNVTGASNRISSVLQFAAFRRIMPNLKTLGIIYSPGEANSVAVNEEMKTAAKELGLTLIFSPASKTSDVQAASLNIIDKVDALFVNNDNIALAAFDAILKVAQEHKKPAFVSDVDLVGKGALAAMGPDQHKIGIQAGKMVVEILQGKKASEITPTLPEKPLLYLNLRAAKRLGLVVDDSVIREAIRIEN